MNGMLSISFFPLLSWHNYKTNNIMKVVCSLIVVYIIVNKILQLAKNFIIKSNRKIVERGEIESLNTHIHDAHFPGLQQKH